MINVTEAAQKQIRLILSEEPIGDPTVPCYLRLAVQGGGCSGFSYQFSIESQADDDNVYEGIVIVDPISLQYLNNATVDYKKTIQGSSFTIDNPHVRTTCGCGSSFSI